MSEVSRELIQASASSKIPAATPLRRLKRDKATEWTVPQQGDRNEYPHAAAAEGNVELSEDASDEAAVALPDGGRTAWMQVAASFLINLNVYGAVNAFGVFQNFYETEQLTSYSSSTISWIGTLQGSLILFIGAVAGPLFDKGYFMLTLRGAAIGLVFSWMMLSLSTQYYQVRACRDCIPPCYALLTASALDYAYSGNSRRHMHRPYGGAEYRNRSGLFSEAARACIGHSHLWSACWWSRLLCSISSCTYGNELRLGYASDRFYHSRHTCYRYLDSQAQGCQSQG